MNPVSPSMRLINSIPICDNKLMAEKSETALRRGIPVQYLSGSCYACSGHRISCGNYVNSVITPSKKEKIMRELTPGAIA